MSTAYLVLWHMNHGLTLIVSLFYLSRLVSRNLGRWVWASTLRVYKVFTKTGRGPWLRGDCLGPTGVINCTPLSALSFWVSLFPGTRGYNTPYVPSSLPPSQAATTEAANPPPLPVLEARSETSVPPSTLRVPRLYPDLPRSLFMAGPCSFPSSTPPFTGSSWSRRHCSGSCPILPHRSISDWKASWLLLLWSW